MHLVFVTSLVPDGAPSTGYEIANAAIISALREQGVRMTVLGYARPGKSPSDPDNTVVLGEIDPVTEHASGMQKLRWLLRAFADGLTISSAKLRLMEDSAFKQALADIGDVDGYVINAVQMGAAYEACLTDRPWLYVAHNVEHVSARQNAEAASSPVNAWLFGREARLLEAIETRFCDRSRFVFTLAEDDRREFGLADPQRSTVLPLVTGDRPDFRFDNHPITHDAGLIGTWTWQPNRIGLDWFLGEVVPHLDPSFSVAIAGSIAEPPNVDHPNVRFVGRVDDARDFICAGALVPLISRAGTGVQLKTIETFEMGLPSVATSLALRGISIVPSNCVVADDAKAFATAMMQVAREPRRIDGSGFFDAQKRGIETAITTGLRAMGHARELEPA